MVIQQLITTFIVQPHAKKRIEKELQDKPIVEVVTQAKLDSIIHKPADKSQQSAAESKQHQDLRKRNQGKQQRNKHK